MNEDQRHKLSDTMKRYGGSFVKALGEAVLQADNPHHFARALIDMRRWADDGNRRLLEEQFQDVWAVFTMTEDARLDALRKAYPAYWEKYIKWRDDKRMGPGR